MMNPSDDKYIIGRFAVAFVFYVNTVALHLESLQILKIC